jgi:hypothetical protein
MPSLHSDNKNMKFAQRNAKNIRPGLLRSVSLAFEERKKKVN